MRPCPPPVPAVLDRGREQAVGVEQLSLSLTLLEGNHSWTEVKLGEVLQEAPVSWTQL